MKGINIFNPVEIEREYYLKAIEYAKNNGIDHIQINGPIHDGIKGNIGGMTLYKKYSAFNDEKDTDYVNLNLKVVNECLEVSRKYGIKTYLWHHELDLPDGFKKAYPEVVNNYGDIEVSHPIVKDFLENRIKDFFESYPLMDGIVLTLHETKVPLLKLKNQKSDRVERVKFVTEALYDACKKFGKELIVRPFASVEEDYEMMTKAYEEISKDLVIMDKWTQFDWSLCLPHNRFFNKIRNNPLMVEADIFGEYFGKGKLPIYLKEHIEKKIEYCKKFNPVGYCSRIDRAGVNAFGTVNEVNYVIMMALQSGKDVEEETDKFFNERYGKYGAIVKELMQETELIQKEIFYVNGYYFTELSRFPSLNHCKNHFYFEMMRENYSIKSNEWFIPKDYNRGSLESLINEKKSAVEKSERLYKKVLELKDKTDGYEDLFNKFCNLYYVARIWQQLLNVFIYYIKALEENESYEKELEKTLDSLNGIKEEGLEVLKDNFYCLISDNAIGGAVRQDSIKDLTKEIRESYNIERREKNTKENDLIDYIICGGATEGHNLKKEVNFSDTLIVDGGLCRIAGNLKGIKWSTINAHGWFSYEIKVEQNTLNTIRFLFGSNTDKLDVKITIDGKSQEIHKEVNGREWLSFDYYNTTKESIEIRIDKISESTPFLFGVEVVK